MTLTHGQARAFYDRFGAKQDLQGWYEDPAVDDLVAHAKLREATMVAEFGFGTGRFAERLLSRELTESARYSGCDQSQTMMDLATARLAPKANRVALTQSDGALRWPAQDGRADRLLSTYVLDLLAESDIRALLRDAERALTPNGLLGLVSLTRGSGVLSTVVTGLWEAVYRMRPLWVGGCRPVALATMLGPEWAVIHRRVLTIAGLGSEVLVAQRADSSKGT